MSSASNTPENIALHGWTATPRGADTILKSRPYLHEPGPLLVKDIKFPSDDPIVAKVQAYAREKLPRQTYHHSMRVFYLASAIISQQFPSTYSSAQLSPSTLALTSLLHDIGTTRQNTLSTQLSFEFQGGFIALTLLQSKGFSASQSQAEAVAEAIIRHQDIGTTGFITFLGQIIQLATLYDNVGGHPYIISKETRDDVNREFPREGWAGCFASTIRDEVGLKPWCHTTHIGLEEFVNGVEGNLLMNGYP
ncbi:hypothetical protein V8F33_009982 [Rhypophila sp. PSN 637]